MGRRVQTESTTRLQTATPFGSALFSSVGFSFRPSVISPGATCVVHRGHGLSGSLLQISFWAQKQARTEPTRRGRTTIRCLCTATAQIGHFPPLPLRRILGAFPRRPLAGINCRKRLPPFLEDDNLRADAMCRRPHLCSGRPIIAGGTAAAGVLLFLPRETETALALGLSARLMSAVPVGRRRNHFPMAQSLLPLGRRRSFGRQRPALPAGGRGRLPGLAHFRLPGDGPRLALARLIAFVLAGEGNAPFPVALEFPLPYPSVRPSVQHPFRCSSAPCVLAHLAADTNRKQEKRDIPLPSGPIPPLACKSSISRFRPPIALNFGSPRAHHNMATSEHLQQLQTGRPFEKNSPLRSSLRKHNASSASLNAASNANNGRNRSPAGRKTVSFCSQNADNKRVVSNVSDCLAVMQAGTELVKLRTNVRQFRRIFSLDADMAYIRWTPTNKKPHKARIAIGAIKEVRVGWNSELLRITTEAGIAAEIQEECAFSIIHGDDYECLDLVALNPGDANIWVTGLMALAGGSVPGPESNCATAGGSSAAPANLRERWLQQAFREVDAEAKGYISEKTAVRLIRSLNPRLLISRVKQKVREMGTGQTSETQKERGRIDETQFIEVYKDLATRPEIYFLMVRYANKDYLNTTDLQLFLETEQGLSGVSVDFCENLIDQCEPSAEAREQSLMTVDGFSNYLLSQQNSAFDVAHQSVCQDMGRPFSHYFISTSHNTYLVEDQLKGPSSLDGYTSALKRNCRYIELDVWEPDAGDEPVIYNGGTLTSKLALSEVLDVVAELAFERTRYPLFVRLELHLPSVELQRRLLSLLELKLGTRLYRPAQDTTDWTREAPTPKKLLHKIILSGPRFEGPSEVGQVEEEDESAELIQGFGRGDAQGGQVSPRRMLLIRELSELIAPFAVFARAREAADLAPFSSRRHIVSMSESDCLRLVHTQPSEAYSRFLMRVTPNPQRVDSSNVNPQEFWNFGFPFVALNYQTPGLMMDLQEGKFLANGGCGYVLKPASMCLAENGHPVMDGGDISPPSSAGGPNERSRHLVAAQPQILHLKILSAQQLPRPRASTAKGDTGLDPFVVLEVFGVPADCAEERSKTVRNDSFNPSFDESFQFTISVPELALVRFLVLDDDFIGDDFIGQYTIPFECLQSGYRHIPLLNNEGDALEGSTLFVHVAITNRRGGGKPKKRGLSVKRKMSRVQTGMKSVGVRAIDELFKSATGPLVQFIELKAALEQALSAWNEESGVGASGTVRQGLVRLHGRVAKELGTTQTGPDAPEEQPKAFTVVRSGENQLSLCCPSGPGLADSLQKAFGALDTLLARASAICQLADTLFDSLSDATRRVAECANELNQLAAEAGLRGQKATRASENYAWNVRLLKAQLGLMQSTFADSRDILVQAAESARVLGVLEQQQTGKADG